MKEHKRGMHLAGNIIGIVAIAILLPIFSVNLTLIIKSYAQPSKVPTVFGVAPLVVQTGSMDPAIKANDLIFIKKVDTATLKVGDIIAFQPVGSATVVTHRIIEVYEEDGAAMFRTKGDWNNTPDITPVHSTQVVGLCFHRIEGAGKLAQPKVTVLVVSVLVVVLLLYDLLRHYRNNRNEKNA